MTDQQVGTTISVGSKAIMPNIDKFRKESLEFTNAACTAPHCCPSRASFFTGLYPTEHGVWNNVEVPNALSHGLFDNIVTFPEELKKAGYHNIFSGKWHVSSEEGPENRGFDVVLKEMVSNYGRNKHPNIPDARDWQVIYNENEKMDTENTVRSKGQIIRPGYPEYFQYGVDEDPYGDLETVDKAIVAIEDYDEDAPFFMYVGTLGPHDSYIPPQRFLDMYQDVTLELPESYKDTMLDKPALYRRTSQQFSLPEEENLDSLKHYLAFCSYEDWLFGKLLEAVHKKGIAEDTTIIYMSDHGDYAGAHGLWAKGLPCFKEAYHICTMIGGAGVKARGTCNELVSITDLAPTILELCEVKSKQQFTGQSLCGFLEGNKNVSNWRTEHYTQTNGNEVYGIQRAVWNKKYKFVYNAFDFDELYDLENDPNELYNVADSIEFKPVIKEMWKKLWEFAKKHQDNCTCPYIMVSFAEYGPGILREGQ